MRDQPLSRRPLDLSGTRVLDAGCGVGQAAVAMAMRGAEVVAVDLSPNLPKVARARATAEGVGADRLQRRRPAVR
jgi:magnesium-protoporphyrin O-methyltransferase